MRLALALAALVVASPAEARCEAHFIKDAGAQFSPEDVAHRGDRFGPIAQFNINKKTEQGFYCSHGAGCYPASAIEIIGPCRFLPSGLPDDNEISFDAR